MESHDKLEIEVLYAYCVSANLLNSFAILPRGKAILVAIILNRFDWLWDMNLTIVQAIERVGTRGIFLVTEVSRRYYRLIEI